MHKLKAWKKTNKQLNQTSLYMHPNSFFQELTVAQIMNSLLPNSD